MAREMCPSCRKVQNMDVSSTTRTVTGPDGEKKSIKTLSLHCRECRQFVRAEDLEEASDGPREK